jgi:hypothetical protein
MVVSGKKLNQNRLLEQSYNQHLDMSLMVKQLLINSIPLPPEIITFIKDFTFTRVHKIPRNDPRYNLLETISPKIYEINDIIRVRLRKSTNDFCYYLYYSATAPRCVMMLKKIRTHRPYFINVCVI